MSKQCDVCGMPNGIDIELHRLTAELEQSKRDISFEKGRANTKEKMYTEIGKELEAAKEEIEIYQNNMSLIGEMRDERDKAEAELRAANERIEKLGEWYKENRWSMTLPIKTQLDAIFADDSRLPDFHDDGPGCADDKGGDGK